MGNVYLICQVLSLDLSNNKLRNLDGFKDLGQQASNLKHLKVCNNQVKEITVVDVATILKLRLKYSNSQYEGE